MKIQCPVCDTLNKTPDDPGLDPEVTVQCADCHALFSVPQEALVDALFGPPLGADPFMPQAPDARAAFGQWPEPQDQHPESQPPEHQRLQDQRPEDPWPELSEADPDAPPEDSDWFAPTNDIAGLFGPPRPFEAVPSDPDQRDLASTPDDDLWPQPDRPAFDPDKPLPIPERRPAPRSAGLPPAFSASPALELAARDLPASRRPAALVGLAEARDPNDAAPPERRPMPPAAKAFVGAVLLTCVAAALWITLGDRLVDLGRDALASINAPPQPPEPARALDPPAQPQVVGNYVEHIQTRDDGSTIRVWSPRDGPGALGTGQPPGPPRASNSPRRKAKKTGPPAPLVSLRGPDGQTVQLQELRGKVVVLNFFATWCEPCKREIPDFVRFHDAIKDKDDIQLYGVVMESGAPEQALAGALKMGVTWPTLAGTLATKQGFRLQGYPTTVIIDPEGNIHHTAVGALNYARLTNLSRGALP